MPCQGFTPTGCMLLPPALLQNQAGAIRGVQDALGSTHALGSHHSSVHAHRTPLTLSAWAVIPLP